MQATEANQERDCVHKETTAFWSDTALLVFGLIMELGLV